MRKWDYSSISRFMLGVILIQMVSLSPSYPAGEPIKNEESSISTGDSKHQENNLSDSRPYILSNVGLYTSDESIFLPNAYFSKVSELDPSDGLWLSQTISTYSTLNFMWDFYHNPHKTL